MQDGFLSFFAEELEIRYISRDHFFFLFLILFHSSFCLSFI